MQFLSKCTHSKLRRQIPNSTTELQSLERLLDNSRIRQLADCQLADWTSRGQVNLRTRQLAYWTSRGLDNSRMPPATWRA